MAYVKNPTWTTSSTITLAYLQNLETQPSEISSYLAGHSHGSWYYLKNTMDSYFWNVDNDGDGLGLNADTLEGVESSAIQGGLDSGLIIGWYGTPANVPDGWLLADGENGTTDMRDFLPIGAGGDWTVGSSGGNKQIKPHGTITVPMHTLTILETMHTHSLVDKYGGTRSPGESSVSGTKHPCGGLIAPSSVTDSIGSGGGHNHPGSFAGEWMNLIPPSRGLVFIQKT
jgi:hypothetical protein